MVRVPWWVLVLAAINAVVLAYVVHWNTETLSRAILSLVALIAADALYRVLREAADDGARLHARVVAGMLAGIREDFEHLEETLGKRMDFADALPAQMDALRTGGHAALAKAMAAADDVAELHQRVKAHEQGTEDTNTLMLGRITELEAGQKGERAFFAERITALEDADRTLSEHIKAEVQRRVALDARLDAMDAEALPARVTSLEQKRGVLR